MSGQVSAYVCEATSAVQIVTTNSWLGFVMSFGLLLLPNSEFSDQEQKKMALSALGDAWSLHGTCPICHADGFRMSY